MTDYVRIGDVLTVEEARVYIAPIVELLDEDRPFWVRDIDLSRLQMLDPWGCVLGQVYGDWISGVTALTAIALEREDFKLAERVSLATAVTHAEPVGLAWFELIRERKATV